MPMYEFECRRGHVTTELVPIGTKRMVCRQCDKPGTYVQFARRILSPTRTDFEFADQRRKRSIT